MSDPHCIGRSADTVRFVRIKPWYPYPLGEGRILEFPVSDLDVKAMTCWSRIEDAQAAGCSLPGEALQNRYSALSNRGDATQAEWDAFIDALWDAVHSMTPEELADWFVELNDPVTITARYWIHDGVEYLDAAHTMPRGEG